MLVSPAPVWVPSQWPLVLNVRQSDTLLVNDKGDNEVKLQKVHRSQISAEESPRKSEVTQIGRLHSMSGKKDRMEREEFITLNSLSVLSPPIKILMWNPNLSNFIDIHFFKAGITLES